MSMEVIKLQKKTLKKQRLCIPGSISKNIDLYLLITPVIIYYFIFHYIPIYGVQIAFKNFIPTLGIWSSPWVGFMHFERFFRSYFFWRLITNTLGISFYSLLVGFPIPIILALAMNDVKNKRFKKTVQTVTYIPHFISTVVIVGMIIPFLSPQNGIVNEIIKLFGGSPVPFMTEGKWFKSIYVISTIWQEAGWGSIIYMAALAGINEELYEAAIIDGASKVKRLWHITLPLLIPTITIMLILRMGRIMNVGFEKILLMQNPLTMDSSDIIKTYVYRAGLLNAQYSFSSAIDLFNSLINAAFLFVFNQLSRKISETSLW